MISRGILLVMADGKKKKDSRQGEGGERKDVHCRIMCARADEQRQKNRGTKRWKTYLLHDTGLALGKGNVATRLVLDELDFNLSSLAAGLVVVVVIVVGGSAGALDAAVLHAEGAIAVV